MLEKLQVYAPPNEESEIKLIEIAWNAGYKLYPTNDTAFIHMINLPVTKCTIENGTLKVVYEKSKPTPDSMGEKYILEGPSNKFRSLNKQLILYEFEPFHPIITLRPEKLPKK